MTPDLGDLLQLGPDQPDRLVNTLERAQGDPVFGHRGDVRRLAGGCIDEDGRGSWLGRIQSRCAGADGRVEAKRDLLALGHAGGISEHTAARGSRVCSVRVPYMTWRRPSKSGTSARTEKWKGQTVLLPAARRQSDRADLGFLDMTGLPKETL